MRIPNSVRSALKDELWRVADEFGWNGLGQSEKANYYEVWTRDPEIGGRLGRFMDAGQVRVYIKDTLLKDYGRVRLADPGKPLRALGLEGEERAVEEYIKPHGRRLADNRVICWGRADDWKTILLALHERAYLSQGQPFAGVLMYAAGRYHQAHGRLVVEDAARKLGIARLVWLD